MGSGSAAEDVVAARASVIVNNYNYGRFLGDAIDGALAQTYPDTEVIVVDDGSTDDSRAVITRYGSQVVPVLKENGGQGSALNAGFAVSRGEVVVFLDADDVLLPGAIAAVMPYFRPIDVAKVQWTMPIIDAAGRRSGHFEEPELNAGDFREAVRLEGPLSDATLPSAPTSGNAWSRRFLTRVMPMPEDPYKRGADTYLFGLAPAFGRIVLLEHPQSLYRLHDSNRHSARTFAETLDLARLDLDILPPIAAQPYREAGVEIDLNEWRRRSWWGRVDRAVEAIIELIPEGERFLLADQDAWGTDSDFFGRRRVPFTEHGGEYNGIPDGDGAAIEEVERWRVEGALALVFAWPAHWWLEYFGSFAHHLESQYRCLRRDELLTVFDLRV